MAKLSPLTATFLGRVLGATAKTKKASTNHLGGMMLSDEVFTLM